MPASDTKEFVICTNVFVDVTKAFVYISCRFTFSLPFAVSKEAVPMARQRLPRPTDAELAILEVLWQRGPSTVREVQEALHRQRPTGYTTVLKFLQIMTEKGLVVRDESQRTHVYRPRFDEADTQRQLVGDLLDRAFGGSTQKLVMQALSARKASPEELDQIRRLLDQLERGPQ